MIAANKFICILLRRLNKKSKVEELSLNMCSLFCRDISGKRAVLTVIILPSKSLSKYSFN